MKTHLNKRTALGLFAVCTSLVLVGCNRETASSTDEYNNARPSTDLSTPPAAQPITPAPSSSSSMPSSSAPADAASPGVVVPADASSSSSSSSSSADPVQTPPR